jgi:D-cysteine desulfhydrase
MDGAERDKMKETPIGTTRPWLFEAFPALEHHLPWRPLVEAPTPVHPLDALSKHLGGEVWIKRDDKTSHHYGGNKPRKLEFLLGEALDRNYKTLITGGGIGTNHGLATAIFGRQLGFHVILGLFKQPVTAHVRKSLLLYHAYGAEMVFVDSLPRALWRYFIADRIRRRDAYFVAPGGSSAAGVLGFVDAGLELAMQVERKEMPFPKAIYLPVGSCGTMAGLMLGLRLAGLKTRVVGVQVAPRLFANPKLVSRLARKTVLRMRRYDGSIPLLEIPPASVTMDRDHYGSGYGHPTDGGRRALALMARAEGIDLDLTYTAKTLSALLYSVRFEREKGPVLFWNTFNSVDLSPMADRVEFRHLPEEFHRFFKGKVVE